MNLVCHSARTSFGAAFFLFSFSVLILAGCADTEPEEPGIETPVVSGVVTGDIKTRREYADAVEAANKRNDERAKQGDWRHVKPAVGPTE